MKKRLIAIFIGMLVIGPVGAFADTNIPTQPTVEQLWARVAELEAEIVAINATSSVSCAALTSVSIVKINMPFILAWGSVGAMLPGSSTTQSMWPPVRAQSVIQPKPGTWTYPFTFYSETGATTVCATTIKVTP